MGAPINSLNGEGERGLTLKELFQTKIFWLFLLMMTCSGGPTLTGMVSSGLNNNLHAGILAAIVFPILLLMGVIVSEKHKA